MPFCLTSSLFFYTGFLTFRGIDVGSQEYAWFVVVILPVKSALNPLIYMLSETLKWITRKPQVNDETVSSILFLFRVAKFFGFFLKSPEIGSIEHHVRG